MEQQQEDHHSATDGKKAKPHTMRTAFLNDMAALPNGGYPALCRNVAIACGAGNGTSQGFEAGAEQINIDTYVKPLDYYLKINALPDHSELRILDLDLNLVIPWKFLWWESVWVPIPFLHNVRVTVDNTDPYDNCPGGNYFIMKDVGDAICDALGLVNNYTYKESFIPTVSALDLNKSYLENLNPTESYLMTNIYEDITGYHDSCEFSNHDITPFDAIYAGLYNLSHVTGGGINDTTSKWMYNEIIRDTIRFNDETFSSVAKQFEAQTSIIAASTDDGGINHPVIINNSANITFLAGGSITLKPGFHAEQGATFTAKIHRYNGTYLSSSFAGVAYSSLNSVVLMPQNTPVVTSINDDSLRISKLSIVPNPSQGIFTLNTGWGNEDAGIISIYDATGELIHREEMLGTYRIIELNQPAGVYFLKLTRTNHPTETLKFIIKY